MDFFWIGFQVPVFKHELFEIFHVSVALKRVHIGIVVCFRPWNWEVFYWWITSYEENTTDWSSLRALTVNWTDIDLVFVQAMELLPGRFEMDAVWTTRWEEQDEPRFVEDEIICIWIEYEMVEVSLI